MVTIKQNLKLLGGGVPPMIRVTQGDTAVSLLFTLYSGSSIFAKPSGATAVIEATKPDCKAIKESVTYNDDGTVQLTLTEQMTIVAGEVYCKVGIVETDGKVSTAAFILGVEPSGVKDSATISSSEVPDVRKLINAADEVKTYTKAAATSASAAATSASNAKSSASTASTKASAAATSANNAATSENKAASSQKAAATSATNAATSEKNAAGYLKTIQTCLSGTTSVSFDESTGDIKITVEA